MKEGRRLICKKTWFDLCPERMFATFLMVSSFSLCKMILTCFVRGYTLYEKSVVTSELKGKESLDLCLKQACASLGSCQPLTYFFKKHNRHGEHSTPCIYRLNE